MEIVNKRFNDTPAGLTCQASACPIARFCDHITAARANFGTCVVLKHILPAAAPRIASPGRTSQLRETLSGTSMVKTLQAAWGAIRDAAGCGEPAKSHPAPARDAIAWASMDGRVPPQVFVLAGMFLRRLTARGRIML